MGKVKNDNLMTKAIARFSLLDNLELAIGVPYLLQRKQSRTNAAGITTSKFDSQGLGDADIQLTWQWRDSRKGGLGVLTGVELQAPTGDRNDGLGSDTWETSLRSVLSYKTVWGYPYGMAIYTDTGSTRANGVRIDPADDLYLAAGFKSRFWHGFGFDLSTFRYVDTSRAVTENNGSPAIVEKYDSPGWKVYGCYRSSKSFEWNILYERISPEAHQVYLNGTTISKKIDDKERFGAIVKYFW
ncbi:MAG: transporter [Desulfuromonadales bacterium]|nr:transporter [Desulfuromonadales bacterium]